MNNVLKMFCGASPIKDILINIANFKSRFFHQDNLRLIYVKEKKLHLDP